MSKYHHDKLDGKIVDYFVRNYEGDLQAILLAKQINQHYAVAIDAPLLFDACMEVQDFVFKVPETVLTHLDSMLLKALNDVYEKSNQRFEMTLKVNLHARLFGLTFYPGLTRKIIPRSKDVGSFISITGLIIKSSVVQLFQFMKKYTCAVCKHAFSLEIDRENFFKIKGRKKCPNPVGCTSIKFVASDTYDISQWRDYQEVKLQEHVNALFGRTIPRSILVVLENDLVDSCKPGDDVTITGVMSHRWNRQEENTRCHLQNIIIANHVHVNNQINLNRITADTKEYFTNFWSNHKERPLQGRNEIIQNFCTKIYGLFQVKLALALVLAGGVAKADDSDTRVRGQSHMLLIGDTGTGKSEFLRYATKVMPRCVFTTGVGSTSAGLTVSAVRDCGGWHLEAGALVLADGGVCCIDEFDKIKEKDRSCILEAMEQQTISVAKAGMVSSVNSRCTILAATTSLKKCHQNMNSGINLAISTPLLSRFDLVFVMLDTKTDEWDHLVSNYILYGLKPSGVCSELKMSTRLLQSYFCIIKQLKPIVCDDAYRILQSYYLAHRKSEGRNASRTTVRLLEGMVRLAEAHAKLMFRSEVTVLDSISAVIVAECSLGGLELLENNLWFDCPMNPDEQYLSQGEIVMKKLGLQDIWQKELVRIASSRDSPSIETAENIINADSPVEETEKVFKTNLSSSQNNDF